MDTVTAGARTDAPAPPQRKGMAVLAALGPFIGLALVVMLFSVLLAHQGTFLTSSNFLVIAAETTITALGALGMTLIIVSAGIDLSVGSLLALTSVVAALALNKNFPAPVAILLAMGVGALVGVVNGSLITGLRVTPFIVTLGTMGIVRGAASWLANEQAVNANGGWLSTVAQTYPPKPWMIVSPGVWMVVILSFVTGIILRKTVFGRYVIAIGSNETTARLSGLRVDALKIAIYAIAGLYFGLAGVLQFSRLGQGDPTVDVGAELDIIAAVVIGGASLSGGEGSVLGSILGALIMSVLRNGSQQMGWPDYVERMIIGVVIIFAVALDRLRHRKTA